MTKRLLLPGSGSAAVEQLIRGFASRRAIHVVNFHATPRYREAEYRAQLAAYAEAFEPMTPDLLPAAIEGRWPHSRPGLIPALFEGFRDNFDVMRPLLEEYGFRGWFFLPTAFLTVPALEQRAYASEHVLHLPVRDEYPGERVAMTWDEVRELKRRGHVIACHTRNHHELRPETPPAILGEEITSAADDIERELGLRAEAFCWLRGAEVGINDAADALLREAGFKYLVSNFKIQRISKRQI